MRRHSWKRICQLFTISSWILKISLRNHSSQVQHWSDDRWKSCLAAGGRSRRRYQYCSDNSGRILYLRALQGHSGHNLIDPMSQDNVMIQRGIFHHIYLIGCAINLHSIINNGLIPGGQDLSRRQTVFFLPTDPRDKKSLRSWIYLLTSLYHVERNTCTLHGRSIKTRYSGLILIFRSKED